MFFYSRSPQKNRKCFLLLSKIKRIFFGFVNMKKTSIDVLFYFPDIVSVAVRHKTDRRCWSPSTHKDQCSINDGVSVVISPSCTGETEMFIFHKDNTIKHTCSGKCVFVDSNNKLSLRDNPCDTFIKKKSGDSYQIIHQMTKKCVVLSDVKKGELSLQPCGASVALFEFTQDCKLST